MWLSARNSIKQMHKEQIKFDIMQAKIQETIRATAATATATKTTTTTITLSQQISKEYILSTAVRC